MLLVTSVHYSQCNVLQARDGLKCVVCQFRFCVRDKFNITKANKNLFTFFKPLLSLSCIIELPHKHTRYYLQRVRNINKSLLGLNFIFALTKPFTRSVNVGSS